jgi:hypothetical protein
MNIIWKGRHILTFFTVFSGWALLERECFAVRSKHCRFIYFFRLFREVYSSFDASNWIIWYSALIDCSAPLRSHYRDQLYSSLCSARFPLPFSMPFCREPPWGVHLWHWVIRTYHSTINRCLAYLVDSFWTGSFRVCSICQKYREYRPRYFAFVWISAAGPTRSASASRCAD